MQYRMPGIVTRHLPATTLVLLMLLLGFLKQTLIAAAEEWTWQHTARLSATGNGFGAAVALNAQVLVVGSTGTYTTDVSTTASTVHIYQKERGVWSANGILTASGAQRFGSSVAVENATIVVGDDLDSLEAGAVYVYGLAEENGLSWTEQAKLIPSDSQWADLFGAALALSGNTIAVGSFLDNNENGNNAGAVYVFGVERGGWTEQAKLRSSAASEYDEFGSAIALSGDKLVVGTPWEREDNDRPNPAGAVYVFHRVNGVWTEQAKLTASTGDTSDFFGRAVEIVDDTIVVAAQHHNNAEGYSGAAFVYQLEDASWTEQAMLIFGEVYPTDHLALSLSLGNYQLVAGVRLYDGEDMMGSAHLFEWTAGSSWSEQQKLTASDGATDAYFGTSVALQDGTVVVGAPNDQDGQGSVYLFEPSNVKPSTTSPSLAPSSDAYCSWKSFGTFATLVLSSLMTVMIVGATGTW